MLTPTVLRPITPFHAVGSRPAVTLTQSVPQGIDADILLLGCGDVRNLLCTAYHEKGLSEFSALLPRITPAEYITVTRKLDITSCDVEDAIIGAFTY